MHFRWSMTKPYRIVRTPCLSLRTMAMRAATAAASIMQLRIGFIPVAHPAMKIPRRVVSCGIAKPLLAHEEAIGLRDRCPGPRETARRPRKAACPWRARPCRTRPRTAAGSSVFSALTPMLAVGQLLAGRNPTANVLHAAILGQGIHLLETPVIGAHVNVETRDEALRVSLAHRDRLLGAVTNSRSASRTAPRSGGCASRHRTRSPAGRRACRSLGRSSWPPVGPRGLSSHSSSEAVTTFG